MFLYEEIFCEFKKQKVKYLIVGGMAVNLLGSLRSTADLDILVEMTDQNLAKIVKILKKKKYNVKIPIDPIEFVKAKTRKDLVKNKHLKALNFYKHDELKEVDIIIDSPISYEAAMEHCVYVKIGNLAVPVISIDDLIKIKRKTGRSVDKFDVEELKRVKKLKNTTKKYE